MVDEALGGVRSAYPLVDQANDLDDAVPVVHECFDRGADAHRR